jgi:putative DNA methylase
MPQTDQRLIEDYIPIEEISEEARREKSIRKGHISTLHLWWARRPLVAARAAVYGALVPAAKDKKAAKAASEFVARLCKYPGSPDVIKQAQKHILHAHAERLTEERGELVTVEDIEAGRAPRPKVLDMFAGGGAIPLEALRLGCEAYALDLNPVAHLIELCTLVYPQQFGAPDPAAKGCADDGTWAGLAKEVEHWGKWVLEQVRAEIGDLYPPIPDPNVKQAVGEPKQLNMNLADKVEPAEHGKGMLTPVAYLWTRTVTCKNPSCGATVPLARQTWLAKKKGRYVALQPILPSPSRRGAGGSPAQRDEVEKKVKYIVVEATTEKGLGFDPSSGSQGGNVACPFCGTVTDNAYVKAEGKAGRIAIQFLAVVCTHSKGKGKRYLSEEDILTKIQPDKAIIWQRIHGLETNSLNPGSFTLPDEDIEANPRSMDIQNYGFKKWTDVFIPRQLLANLTFSKNVRDTYSELLKRGYEQEFSKAIVTYLGLWVDRIVDYGSGQCIWKSGGEFVASGFAQQSIAMVWDFAEVNPIGNASGNSLSALNWIIDVIRNISNSGTAAKVTRGSATQVPYPDNYFDAVISDPPYYDNVSYSNLSDYFYVWLKRSIGFLYPDHSSTLLTPKKNEAIAAFYRHNGRREDARSFYEKMMSQAFSEAARTLKTNGLLTIVYAHKTTLGWTTLVEALRSSGFMVVEAWPLDTERPGRTISLESASLASSIFLTARIRKSDEIGSYEHVVRPELQSIVRERVERLWAQGVSGADLVIACVGAGLRAFTKYASVEYANGQPVPADTFLAEVEGAVLEALLEKLFGVSGAGVGRVDPATRFYVLWRYAYGHGALDAGEAIVFAYPQRVELDGPGGLTSGTNALVRKDKGKYTLMDFTVRGDNEELGISQEGKPQPALIDMLHRLLWLVENQPRAIPKYLDESRPDIEHLRLIAQTLAGQSLSGNGGGGGKSLVAARGAEASALKKLTANWRTLVEEHRGKLV